MSGLGKIPVLLLLLYWAYWLFFPIEYPWIFLDGVNLIFHEAGHVIFMIFGQFMHVLGGSLTQCLIPFIIGVYFLIKQQYFSANFCLFWLGDNFINVSTYIKDARAMVLPLLGGDSSGHDWHWLLMILNLLPQDQAIGNFVWGLGTLCVLTSVCLGIYIIIFEYLQSSSRISFD